MEKKYCKKYFFIISALSLFAATLGVSLNVKSPVAISIFSINPYEIFVKNSGGIDSSILIYEVRDSSGELVSSGIQVRFILKRSRTDGDQYVFPTLDTTDATGRVSTILHAGLLGDITVIHAIIEGTEIKSAWFPIPILSKVTEVVNNSEVISKDFSLYPNYPNPFNPSTTISYFISEKSNVSLEVLNILGERIELLDQGEKDVGIKTIFWKANIPSGVYFYRLNTYKGSFVRKMLLIK